MKLDLEELADEIIRVEYPTYEQTTIPQMKSSIIRKKEIIRQILEQRIRQACKFYLRYKDNPDLLEREQNISWLGNDRKKYDEWLFKLAFEDVFGGELNGICRNMDRKIL